MLFTFYSKQSVEVLHVGGPWAHELYRRVTRKPWETREPSTDGKYNYKICTMHCAVFIISCLFELKVWIFSHFVSEKEGNEVITEPARVGS